MAGCRRARPWLAFCSGFVGSCCEGRKGTSRAVIIGSGEAVMTRFSVAPIPPEDRSLHWSNFVSGIFFPMRASFSAPERFHGTIENWQLGQISLSRFHSAPVCYDRARQHLRGRPEDDLLITFATSRTQDSVRATTSFTAARTVSSSNAAISRINSRTRKTMSSGS